MNFKKMTDFGLSFQIKFLYCKGVLFMKRIKIVEDLGYELEFVDGKKDPTEEKEESEGGQDHE